jgi:hypothetical protein
MLASFEAETRQYEAGVLARRGGPIVPKSCAQVSDLILFTLNKLSYPMREIRFVGINRLRHYRLILLGAVHKLTRRRNCGTELQSGTPDSLPVATDLHRSITLYAVPCYSRLTSAWSRNSSVCIATGYGLESRASILGSKNLSLIHSVQIDTWAHAASYPMAFESSFPAGKAAQAWSWLLTSIYCRGHERWS